MPYKHIAAHLKKTELACRLHYHQLSHGSNRRKRTTSMSSGSSAGHSPIMPVAAPSPIQEASSRDITPPRSAGSYEPDSPDHQSSVQLPSIMGRTTGTSSHLPAILPKPTASMRLATAPMTSSSSSSSGYPTPLTTENPRNNNNNNNNNLAPSPFPQSSSISQGQGGGPPLRLDCSSLPPPPSAQHVDIARLQAIYAQRRTSFWSVIAAEYGSGVSPIVLEQAWKTANMLSMGGCGGQGGRSHSPITPVTSPNDTRGEISLYEKNITAAAANDKTRISAILGIDANPRSPKEREMVRRLEEGRSVGVVAGA